MTTVIDFITADNTIVDFRRAERTEIRFDSERGPRGLKGEKGDQGDPGADGDVTAAQLHAAVHDPDPAAAGDHVTVGTYYNNGPVLGGAVRRIRYHLELTSWGTNHMGLVKVEGYCTPGSGVASHPDTMIIDILAGFYRAAAALYQMRGPIDRSEDDEPLDTEAAIYLSPSGHPTIAFNATNRFASFRVSAVRQGFSAGASAGQDPGLQVTPTETSTVELT
ncbi:MAG: hypothetical protein AAF567_24570 [Actinomycetota bacterium]